MAHPLINNLPHPHREYLLVDVEKVDDPESCACGHYPIMNVATIKHRPTGEHVRIGTICMKLFSNIAQQIVIDVKRGYYTDTTIDWCVEHSIITLWERKFYQDIRRKRDLSEKQEAVRLRVCDKIRQRFPKLI